MPTRNKILIVDDEIELFGFLIEALEDYGYQVITVDSGENAVKLAEKNFYDIVLMDFNLPGINGLEAFRKIKKVSPLSIVIMMTAAAPESALKEAVVEGSYAVVYKPFKLDDIVKKINEAAKKTTVIVIDDRYTDREVVSDLLEQKGCKCVTIADGRSALEMLKHERPDIILLDISMPDMNGFEVLEKVKEAYPDIDVIMMSAYTKDEHIEMALKMGALTCLNKPVQVEKILDVVDKMKTKQQQERGKTSILLVEDDTALSSTLATILQDNHYTVSSVPTGIGAIEESKKKFYNAAIVDFKLPDMSGIDVIKQLKNVNPQAVIILMTAYESLDLAINAIKEHVFDFLVKPVEPDTLLKSLRKGLHL